MCVLLLIRVRLAGIIRDIQQQMRQGFMEANAIERQQVRPIQGRAMEPEPEPAYSRPQLERCHSASLSQS